ncbi:hypothetical protein [Methylobacillus flagellatus]|uniref:hypothetical protein n=1 Tax=Methylobacillus flagellatus TaxID=405 RepID=UPI0010F48658|nr:hypothetical protein [Methylobacillus flagellatus]
MISIVKAFLGKYQLPMLLIMAGLVLAYIGTLKLQVGMARGDLMHVQGELAGEQARVAQLQQELGEWSGAYTTLAKLTQEQSAGIEQLKQASEAAKIRSLAAIKNAEVIAEARAGAIIAATARAASPDLTCDQAVDAAKAELMGSML